MKYPLATILTLLLTIPAMGQYSDTKMVRSKTGGTNGELVVFFPSDGSNYVRGSGIGTGLLYGITLSNVLHSGSNAYNQTIQGVSTLYATNVVVSNVLNLTTTSIANASIVTLADVSSDLFLYKTVTGSYQYSAGYSYTSLTMGTLITGASEWSTYGGGATAYWARIEGPAVPVDQFKILPQMSTVVNPGNICLKVFEIDGSMDGSTYTFLCSGTLANSAGIKTITITNNVAYTYYKFTFTTPTWTGENYTRAVAIQGFSTTGGGSSALYSALVIPNGSTPLTFNISLWNTVSLVSNMVFWSSNTALWASNSVTWASNNTVWASNSMVWASNTLLSVSNTASWASNHTTWASNTLLAVSNMSAWASNSVLWTSNTTVWASNTLLVVSNMAAWASNNIGSGSGGISLSTNNLAIGKMTFTNMAYTLLTATETTQIVNKAYVDNATNGCYQNGSKVYDSTNADYSTWANSSSNGIAISNALVSATNNLQTLSNNNSNRIDSLTTATNDFVKTTDDRTMNWQNASIQIKDATLTNEAVNLQQLNYAIGSISVLYVSTNKNLGVSTYYDARTFLPTHTQSVISVAGITNGQYLATWVSNTNIISQLRQGIATLNANMRLASVTPPKWAWVKPEIYIRKADTTEPELFETATSNYLNTATFADYNAFIDCNTNALVASDERVLVKWKCIQQSGNPTWEFKCGTGMVVAIRLPVANPINIQAQVLAGTNISVVQTVTGTLVNVSGGYYTNGSVVYAASNANVSLYASNLTSAASNSVASIFFPSNNVWTGTSNTFTNEIVARRYSFPSTSGVIGISVWTNSGSSTVPNLGDNNMWTGTSNTFAGTQVVISSNLTVGGIVNAGIVSNACVMDYCCTCVGGGQGAAYASYYGPSWVVAYSDTDAYFMGNFFVRTGGTFKVGMVWMTITANSSKTMGGSLNVATNSGGVISWNVFSSSSWNLAIPDPNESVSYSTYGTAFTVPNNSYVPVQYQKGDNAGGATGNIYVYGWYLIRQ